ncbi:MAG: hypothetical protein AAF333_10065 [Planctomycetota bacterium]
MTHAAEPNSENLSHERPGLTLGGPWIVAATLSLFIIVPLVSVGAWFLLISPDKRADPPPPLAWSERHNWPRSQFTVFKSLERGPMSSARTNKVHNEKIGLRVPPAEIRAVLRCGNLAALPREAFASDATRQILDDILAETPGLFYGHYLRGTWHRLRGEAAEAEAAYTRAFDLAPAALLRHHVGTDGKDAAYAAAPAVALVADRIVNDQRDSTLVLLFPHLKTDADGFVYLPVYKAILRQTDADRPAGVIDATDKPLWFTWWGNVGRLADVTLESPG